MRWPVLLDRSRMRISNFSKVIITCVGLHNFLINTGSSVFEDLVDFEDMV
jgi:hypothetical protein